MNAYGKEYLNDAQENLALFLDYGVNHQKTHLRTLWGRFLMSPLCSLFEKGDYSVISGCSGIELYFKVIDKQIQDYIDYASIDRSKEFWLGYYLAYYQWRTSISFKFINRYIKIEEILSLYNPYHEMDMTNFLYKMNDIINEKKKYTNLAIKRTNQGLTRAQLSLLSDVPERVIEQYEQRKRNIDRANALYVSSLAKALNCKVDEILELTDNSLYQ